MKVQADQHRSDKSFAVGDWAYLKLQPYRQYSLRVKGFSKLSPPYVSYLFLEVEARQ